MIHRLEAGAFAFCWLVFAVSAGEPAGKIADLNGDVQLTPVGGAAAKAKKDDSVSKGDKVVTGAAPAFLQIDFLDQSTVKLGPNSDLVIAERRKEVKKVGLLRKKPQTVHTTVLSLSGGSAFVNVKGFKKRTSRFEVRTPTAVAGVRGTRFLIIVHPGTPTAPPRTEVFVFDGTVTFSAAGVAQVRQRVRRGRQSTQSGQGAPTQSRRIDQSTFDVLQQKVELKDELTSQVIPDTPTMERAATRAQQVQIFITQDIDATIIDQVRQEANPTTTGGPVPTTVTVPPVTVPPVTDPPVTDLPGPPPAPQQ